MLICAFQLIAYRGVLLLFISPSSTLSSLISCSSRSDLSSTVLSIPPKWKDIKPHIRSLWITLSSVNDAEQGDHSQSSLLVVGRNVISGTITSGAGLPLMQLSALQAQQHLHPRRKEKRPDPLAARRISKHSPHTNLFHMDSLSVSYFLEPVISIIRRVPLPRVNRWAWACEMAGLCSP